jgi:hypothetical protein
MEPTLRRLDAVPHSQWLKGKALGHLWYLDKGWWKHVKTPRKLYLDIFGLSLIIISNFGQWGTCRILGAFWPLLGTVGRPEERDAWGWLLRASTLALRFSLLEL